MTQLHGHSREPLFVKKISLRIWSLQDEIEAIIVEKLKNDPEIAKNKLIEELTQEYSTNVIPLIQDTEAIEEKKAEEPTEGETEEAKAEESANEEEKESQDTISDDITKVSQRTPLIIEDKLAYGTTIISEITMNDMYLFCTNKFILGSAVVIEFLVPKLFSVSGVIAHCREVNMKTRVISNKKMLYRIGVKFNFIKEGERSLLREFLQSIESTTSKSTSKVAVSAPVEEVEEEEEDLTEDSDELDDLDL